jgi:hypothetical protein
MIEILNPRAFWFLLILVFVFVVFFWRLPTRKITVTTWMFWKETASDNRVFFFFHGVRRFLPFALSLIFVLLITAAAADVVYRVLPDKQLTYNNISITRFQPRLLPSDPTRFDLLVEVSNFGDELFESRLRIRVGDQVADVVPVLIKPHETTTVIRQLTHPNNTTNQIVHGELEIDNKFDTNNITSAILPPIRLQKIIYYGDDIFFLIRVLQSQLNVTFRFAAELPSYVPPDSVLVISRRVPPVLPVGNILIFDPRSGCDLFGVGEEIFSPVIVGFEQDNSQLLKFIKFTGKEFFSTHKLNLIDSKNTITPEIILATPENQPLCLHYFRNKNTNSQTQYSEVIVFAADISRGDLALQTIFPIFITNMLNQFRHTENEINTQTTQKYTQTESQKTELEQPTEYALWFWFTLAAICALICKQAAIFISHEGKGR